MKGESHRTVLLGIDGFCPVTMDRFLSTGRLPALSGLARDGARVRLISTLPATTPVAWASIVTGCPPSATGVEGFLIHRSGHPFDERVSGCYAHRCRTEPIWQTVTNAGLRSIVVKFPVSYPSTTASFRLDGAAGWGGLKCLHEVSSTGVSGTDEPGAEIRIGTEGPRWAGEPTSAFGRVAWTGRWTLPNLWGKGPVELHVAGGESLGGPRFAVSEAPSWNRLLAAPQVGEWTSPLTIHAESRRGSTACSFRAKVLACHLSPPAVRVYHTPVHERTGHSTPAECWDRHLDTIGPIEEQTEPSLFLAGAIDLDTQMDLFRLNQQWLIRAALTLLEREEWDLFMIQAHFVDWAHHMLQGGIDPRHPDYDPTRARFYEDRLAEIYGLADELVGEVRRAVGPTVNVIALGDHGQDLHHTTFHVNEWLAAQGWLTWDGERVKWERTVAYAAGNYVYINTRGRDPDGLVPAERAADLAEEVAGRLLAASDPEHLGRPVLLAAPKATFAALGADGAGVGDVVFCLSSGYQARNGRGPVFARTRFLREFTSGHDHFWPLDPRLHTRMYAAGPRIRRGFELPGLRSVTDVAPTLAEILAIPPPADSVGRALDVTSVF